MRPVSAAVVRRLARRPRPPHLVGLRMRHGLRVPDGRVHLVHAHAVEAAARAVAGRVAEQLHVPRAHEGHVQAALAPEAAGCDVRHGARQAGVEQPALRGGCVGRHDSL
jgi:hypothetical protein